MQPVPILPAPPGRAAIRVLVVDDSATMRALITRVLQDAGDIAVVGQAADPVQARRAIKALDPDVITLDIEMPQMSGLDFLQQLMRLRPMPVVMVSHLTARGAEASLRALELGAVECVPKPRAGEESGFAQLAAIVRVAATARLRPLRRSPAPAAPNAGGYAPPFRILALGASTGGVEALLAILGAFPANCPATVITQHMPAPFTPAFARRLSRACAAAVSEASEGAPLTPGRVYLAPGGLAHLEVAGPSRGPWRCRLAQGDPVNGHRPAVDVLFASVAAAAGPHAVGMVLTGMGRDGARGLLAMRQAGAHTLGQDEASSVVYGMPRAAFEAGAVEHQVPLHAAGPALLAACARPVGLLPA